MMKRWSGFTVVQVVIAIVVIGLAVAVVWTLAFGRQRMGTASRSQNVQEATSAASPTRVDRVDARGWKIYQNRAYGYSFHYPAGWTVEESAEAYGMHSLTAIVRDQKGVEVFQIDLADGQGGACPGHPPSQRASFTIGDQQTASILEVCGSAGSFEVLTKDEANQVLSVWVFGVGTPDEQVMRQVLVSMRGMTLVGDGAVPGS